jgi:hypothetical protein
MKRAIKIHKKLYNFDLVHFAGQDKISVPVWREVITRLLGMDPDTPIAVPLGILLHIYSLNTPLLRFCPVADLGLLFTY